MRIDEIEPARTAMIVVDMQNDFVAPGAPLETPAARAMVPKLSEALKLCRRAGVRVIYTAHSHRRDGCDMGLFDDIHPPIAMRNAVIDDTPGVNIYADLAPAAGEHVIKKHRYSGFFGTDLDIILREWGIDTVIISGPTTENCCHRQRATPCFATIASCSCQMPPRLTTIPTEASDRWQTATFTRPRSSYSPPQRRMSCRYRICTRV